MTSIAWTYFSKRVAEGLCGRCGKPREPIECSGWGENGMCIHAGRGKGATKDCCAKCSHKRRRYQKARYRAKVAP